MKKQTKTYFRTFYISFIIIMCLVFGWLGISLAYENTVQIAFGEYKNAVEISENGFRILDFSVEF